MGSSGSNAHSNDKYFHFQLPPPFPPRPGTGSSGKLNIPPQPAQLAGNKTMWPGVGGGGGPACYSLSTTGPADQLDNFHSIFLLCCAARLVSAAVAPGPLLAPDSY